MRAVGLRSSPSVLCRDAAVFCQRRVLRFTAGLPAGFSFCRVCGVVSFVSGIRVIGLGPFSF